MVQRAVLSAWRGVLRWQNTLVAIALVALVLGAIRLYPHAPLSAHADSSTALHGANGELLRLTLSRDDKYRQWLPLAQMPPALVEAVQLHEDAWFRWHPGFNPVSLVRGAWVSYVRGGSRQGGSTLTMQLARLMYRLNTRSPLGKAEQIARAVWLEMRYSKDEILEAYLNYAPYGRNVEGVAAASLVYFGKRPQDLALPEVLALAVVPQDPTRRLRDASGTAGDDKLNRGLRAARDRLYARWRETHGVDAVNDALMRLPLDLRAPAQLPFVAPHAMEQVLREARGEGGLPPQIATTIDAGLQRAIERQLHETLQRERVRGVDNAAALLVDTRDMSVKALVGSGDYGDAAIAGQVNGTAAKRSPGSTLKPFIYALGMDQGVLHPRTVLRDVPSAFGPFTPENYDGRFLGPVTATDALIRSRNIPAVWVASQLAEPNLYEFLKRAGISRMASERHYGLALVLGGGEVTMQELATLYAMLANRGVLKPLRLRASEPQTDGVRLVSDAASFMTLDMLRQNPRPDEATTATPARLPIYWKTGTSWGFRDAWTAGIFGPYVLVVWMGNFDGAGNPALIGVETAAPLFFRIADAILARDRTLAEPAWTVPDGVRKVEICLASGDLPNAWCPQRGTTWFMPGRSPIRVSTVHRPVTIDVSTGAVACPPFDPATTRTEVYEFWPSDLARVFAQAGIPRRKPPPDAACERSGDGDAPRITSPLRGAAYTIRARHGATADEARVAFNATVDAGVREVYWFVDDDYVGAVPAGETLFWRPLAAGSHRARVVDDHGRSETRELRVVAVD
ncbi:MAG TPA: penicillin-binding protein 1C [Tahibacter sp.]|uniref:penicillin-binding protein 1C n=1 Tax=Tahibacter sp. TaxID=2056211 RepID=UPI002C2246D7|nr:penicillin-binding protein 1C [Tahibacter sp.]HSX59610.1 penicillin-binding protein 1C [Tahibacter sp.]